MKVNIYYGGRGLIEDPTLHIINSISSVLEELRVEVKRYNLYDKKNEIYVLPKTLKEADAVILASTIEWFGVGGYMQQFLDACWLYADKSKLSSLLMLPIITSSNFGEREGLLFLQQAWELLGGKALNGISAFVKNHVDFETNKEYTKMIENEAENFYRYVNKKVVLFESSTLIYKDSLERNRKIELSPQENEQLSAYVSDDSFVKKQKEDIEELTQMFKQMMTKDDGSQGQLYIEDFKRVYKKTETVNASFSLVIEEINKTLIIEINNKKLKCYYGEREEIDLLVKITKSVINDLLLGRTTLYGAFMAGNITAKGDFQKLKEFDKNFIFNTQ